MKRLFVVRKLWQKGTHQYRWLRWHCTQVRKSRQAYTKGEGSPKRVSSRAIFYEFLILQRPTELTRHGNEELQTARTKIGLKKGVCDVSGKSRRSKRDESDAHL